jgi:very-short-patch-repair endonuclease
MVVEVDGDTYHRESPADAHARLQPLDHEGAKIERVKADECDVPEKANACADRILQILKKKIGQRG